MRLLERLGIYARAPDGRSVREIEDDIRDEIASHIAMRTDALVAEGVAEDVARQRAHEAFGDAERVYAACRETDLGERLMLQRINFALMIVALVAIGVFAWRAEATTASTGEAFGRLEGQLESLAGTVRDSTSATSDELAQLAGTVRESGSSTVVEDRIAEIAIRLEELRAAGAGPRQAEVVSLQQQIDALTSDKLRGVIGEGAGQGSAGVRGSALGVLGAVTRPKSDQVFVFGYVEEPGGVDWDKDLTLLMALSECGGTQQFADLTKVRIIRDKKKPIVVDVKEIIESGEGDLELKKGDRIVVPEAFF